MNLKSLLSSLVIIGLLFLSTISGPGCASIIPPTGGPKDSLPPVLIKADPPDSTKGFKNKVINFTFDEYVELEGVQENLLISPTPKIFPFVESKLRTVTIKIKDTLEANTTYVYNFGKAIKDVNEGNIYKGFTYMFTTGSYIDSIELNGKVILAETGGFDSTLIVMLHRNGADSAVVNENPRYIARLDTLGNFRFRYLPSGKFYMYALKDEGGAHRYFKTDQLFAFTNEPLELKPGLEPVTLYAFAEKKPITLETNVQAQSRNTSNRTDERRLKFATNQTNFQQDLLSPLIINFELPLAKFDSSKIQFSTDSSYTPEKNFSLELDSLRKKIILKTQWKESIRYNLILDKTFAEDSSGRKLFKTDTLKFVTKKLNDYGSVKFSFTNFDSTNNPVLQLILAERVVKSFTLTTAGLSIPLFQPGEYDLRILYDTNKNGKWDTGDFWNGRKQPELAKPISKKITIKANWDNEFEIVL